MYYRFHHIYKYGYPDTYKGNIFEFHNEHYFISTVISNNLESSSVAGSYPIIAFDIE